MTKGTVRNTDLVFSDNSITKDTASFTIPEVIIDVALIINLMYSLLYPVYSAINGYYHFIVLLFMVLLLASEARITISVANAVGIIAFVLVSIVVIYLNHSGFGLIILSLWPLTIIYTFTHLRFSSKYINRINIIVLAGWFVALLASFGYNDQFFYNYEIGVENTGINPNTVAVIIVFTSLFLELQIDNASGSKKIKGLIFFLSFFALYRTKARLSLVAYLAVIMMGAFGGNLIKKHRKLGMLIAIAIVSAGIIFPFVYTMLYSKGIVSYQAMFLGKRVFTGRQYIWLSLWEYLQTHENAYLIGVGYNPDLYSRGTFNLHNAYIMLFAQYGIPLLLVYLWYIFHSIRGIYNKNGMLSNLQLKCYQIMVYVLMLGFGETVLTYLPNMIFIAMAIGIGTRENRRFY